MNRREFLKKSLEGIVNKELTIPKTRFLDRLRNKIAPYILSLGILAGAYFVDLPKSFPADYRGAREWLMQLPSARCGGMGGGSVAIVDNANTVFWNPGGTVFLNGLNLSYTYEPYKPFSSYNNSKIHNFSFIKKFKKSFAIGLNLRKYYLLYNDWTRVNKYKDYDIGISFGYRRKNIGVGINAKYLFSKREFFNVKNTPLAIDIGMLYSRNYNMKKYILNFNIGASLLNSSNGIEYDYYGTKYLEGLPNIVRVGYAATFNLPKRKLKLNPLSITHNLEYSEIINCAKTPQTNGYEFLGYGLEVILYEMFSFRVGNHSLMSKRYYDDMSDIGFSYGFGLNFPLYHFYKKVPLSIKYDYARYPFYQKSYNEGLHYYKINSFSIQYMF